VERTGRKYTVQRRAGDDTGEVKEKKGARMTTGREADKGMIKYRKRKRRHNQHTKEIVPRGI
jgi:hypothetical protein